MTRTQLEGWKSSVNKRISKKGILLVVWVCVLSVIQTVLAVDFEAEIGADTSDTICSGVAVARLVLNGLILLGIVRGLMYIANQNERGWGLILLAVIVGLLNATFPNWGGTFADNCNIA